MLLDNFLHDANEVFGLFFVRVVFVAGNALDFAVGDAFLELVEGVHAVRVLFGHNAWFDQFFVDKLCDVAWRGWHFAKFHECGVSGVDNGPVEINSCLKNVPVRVVDGAWRAGKVRPDALFARANASLEEELLDRAEKARVVEGHAIAQHVDGDRITVAHVFPKRSHLKGGHVQALANLGGNVFGDDPVALDDFVAHDNGKVVDDKQNVDVALAVERFFFAGGAAKQNGGFEKVTKFMMHFIGKALGKVVVR